MDLMIAATVNRRVPGSSPTTQSSGYRSSLGVFAFFPRNAAFGVLLVVSY